MENWDSDSFEDLEDNADQYSRLNTEWSTLVALRDAMGIAIKGARDKSASYRQALLLGERLIPELFDPENSLLNKRKFSETARRFIQIAEASSEPGQKPASPVELLKEEIAKFEKLLEKESLMQDMNLVRKELNELRIALTELQMRKTPENTLIFRDYKIKREFPISHNGDDYMEFIISDKRTLRIRILHNTKSEYKTGTDLIYENYWEVEGLKLVRFVALQYKIWDNTSLYMDKRMRKQLGKMKNTYCDVHLCAEDSDYKHEFRLPYCSAFLRPTSELQSADATFLSKGCYAPICVVRNAQQKRAKSKNTLLSKDIRSGAVTHKIFEEMFNSNMLGSKWLTYKQLEDLYHANNVLDPDDRIVIHAQELPLG